VLLSRLMAIMCATVIALIIWIVQYVASFIKGDDCCDVWYSCYYGEVVEVL
jgi:hypothetical protein